jgi:hypothetical protein
MAVNGRGMVAAVLNRQGSLGPAPGKRSRGELPLLALAYRNAADAAAGVSTLDAGAWRSFNLVITDRSGAWFLRGLGAGRPEAWPLGPGAHMITAHDPDDCTSPRIARHLPRFRAAPPPTPGDWDAWRAILSDRSGPAGSEINIPSQAGFGTVCSSLLALPQNSPPIWFFAPGAPDEHPFRPVQVQQNASDLVNASYPAQARAAIGAAPP